MTNNASNVHDFLQFKLIVQSVKTWFKETNDESYGSFNFWWLTSLISRVLVLELKSFSTALIAISHCCANANEDCDSMICPLIYAPICAKPQSGGEPATFSNDCALRYRECKSKTCKKSRILQIWRHFNFFLLSLQLTKFFHVNNAQRLKMHLSDRNILCANRN